MFDYVLDESSGTFIRWSDKSQERMKILAGGFTITPEVRGGFTITPEIRGGSNWDIMNIACFLKGNFKGKILTEIPLLFNS